MKLLIISCSLNPESNSFILAQTAGEVFVAKKVSVELLDLRTLPLPLCDGAAAYGDKNVAVARDLIASASAILLAAPVYNFDLNAAAKNLVELTGKAWENKIVGFLCAAGGESSYMSIMGFANSLMLDFRCLIVPRFVYATGDAFEGQRLVDEQIRERVEQLAGEIGRLAAALS